MNQKISLTQLEDPRCHPKLCIFADFSFVMSHKILSAGKKILPSWETLATCDYGKKENDDED